MAGRKSKHIWKRLVREDNMRKINLFLDWIKQHSLYIQFLPTKKDLKSQRLKELASRLRSDSKNKTLINILEWQDRNIKAWEERWIFPTILNYLVIISIGIISSFGKTNPCLLLLLIPLLFLGNITLNIVFILIVLILFILLIPLFFSLSSSILSISSTNFLIFILFSFILGAFISLLKYLSLKYRNLKNHIPDFDIRDTFKLSLSIDKILKYKLSICRDYAKLTSALILTIYPKEEIYYVLIPQHVAVGIKLNDRIYVLDQKLPILILDKWKEKWRMKLKKRNLKINFVRVYLEDKNIKIKSLTQAEAVCDLSKPDLNDLINETRRSLNLKNKKPKIKSTSEIYLKDFMTIFSNDDLVKSSIQEAIKNNIRDELATNIDNLIYFDAEVKNRDIILKLWLK